MGRAPNWQVAEEKPVVVIGAGGMLATALIDELETREYHYVALSEHSLDITYEGRVAAILKGINPRLIINTAAYTDVDGAETDRDLAFEVNANGAHNVAAVAQAIGATVLHISTDHVFNGVKPAPYISDDATNPVNVYGESKLKGERLVQETANDHLIVRTSWLFGPYGNNFVTNMLDLGQNRNILNIVKDQHGSPTYTCHLAGAILSLFEKGARGIYHITNSGSCSWFEFAKEIFKLSGMEVEVRPCSTVEYPRLAKRPANSVLDCTESYKVLGLPLPTWQEAVKHHLEGLAK